MDAVFVSGNLFLIAVLILLNGFFVAAEFTIVKVRPSQLEALVKQGNMRARYAQVLVNRMDVSLSVTQLGITLVSLALGWVGEPFLSALLYPVFELAGIPEALTATISFVVAFSLITAGHIIIGELAPKNIAIQRSLGVLLFISMPLLLFQRLTYPFVWLLNHVANFVTRCAGFEPAAEKDEVHSTEELRILMAESRKHGAIDQTEYDFVDNVFSFSDKEVRDIMVPRTDMVCLFLDRTIEESIEVALQKRLTRYPLCREDKDDIIGFLHIKDLLEPLCHGHRPNLHRLARRTLFVPEPMSVTRLLRLMQQKKVQLAIVVDEYGGTAGMVTIEDVIEEIVGDIQDEFDQERPIVECRGARLFSVDAKLLLEEVNDILELDIQADNVDTIGGWLYAQVETPPRIGQTVSYEGSSFFVEEVEHLRITRVLVKTAHDLLEEHEEIYKSGGQETDEE